MTVFEKERILYPIVNEPFHLSLVVQARLHEIGLQLGPQPPSLSNLTQSDFNLFQNLKRIFTGNYFSQMRYPQPYFEEHSYYYFSDGLKKFENRWTRCIDFEGMYIEKYQVWQSKCFLVALLPHLLFQMTPTDLIVQLAFIIKFTT